MYRANFLRSLARSSFSFALLPLLFAGAVHGQSTPDKEPGSSTSTIVKNVDEVSIDFVVRNKKKPVLDLKPEDVVVTDDGTAVKLSDLRAVAGRSRRNHLITLLFDPLDPSAETNAREIAGKILGLIPTSGFSFSVFNADGRLRLFQPFTIYPDKVEEAVSAATSDDRSSRDRAATLAEKTLISAVQSGTGQPDSEDMAYRRSTEQAILAALTESQRIIQDQHAPAPLAGLLALVRSQTAIRGRKLVVYFTEGVRPDADSRDLLRSIAEAASRAEVSIYVINKSALDTHLMDGLMASAAMGGVAAYNRMNPSAAQVAAANPRSLAAGMAAATPVAYGPGMLTQISDQITRIEGEGLAGNQDPMIAMATSTGGAYIFSEDNLKKPFRRAVADLTTYYEASYVPPALEYDGKFRPVTVKTLRRGLKVQSRAGYFAVPPSGVARPFEAPLMKLLSEPQLPVDLKFRAAVLQLGQMTTGNENTLVVEVPVSELETKSDLNASLLSWRVSIVSEVRNKSGAVVEHFSEDISGHGALDTKGEDRACATMQRHFALPPGQYTLETAAVDRNSGKLGGERANFEVPAGASGPFLSDVALVRQIDSSPDELDLFEPLRYKRGKVVPSLADRVSSEKKELSFFFLVHPDSSMSDAAMLELQVLRNGELFGEVPLQLPKDLGEAFPYLASLKTSSLPPGNYDVMLSLTQGGKIMERQSRFIIGGPLLANAALGTTEAVETSKEAIDIADSTPGGAEITPTKRQPLVITSLPPDSVVRPPDEELDRVIAGAREHAVNYSAKLPNFLCVEMTNRSVDLSGNGNWQLRDSFGELLRYVDNQETRTTLEVDGRPSKEKRADMNGPLSLGEFGHVLSLVFGPSSKAEFHWKETDALANGTVQVFEYRVERQNNNMLLSDNSGNVYAGFHGLAYIDSSTMGTRRITMEADGLPRDFSIHAASIAIDYDYVTVGAHDYLMPVRGTIRLKRGRHEADLNQIVFQDYRRFASQTKIKVIP
jgi:VWFA-related protein